MVLKSQEEGHCRGILVMVDQPFAESDFGHFSVLFWLAGKKDSDDKTCIYILDTIFGVNLFVEEKGGSKFSEPAGSCVTNASWYYNAVEVWRGEKATPGLQADLSSCAVFVRDDLKFLGSRLTDVSVVPTASELGIVVVGDSNGVQAYPDPPNGEEDWRRFHEKLFHCHPAVPVRFRHHFNSVSEDCVGVGVASLRQVGVCSEDDRKNLYSRLCNVNGCEPWAAAPLFQCEAPHAPKGCDIEPYSKEPFARLEKGINLMAQHVSVGELGRILLGCEGEHEPESYIVEA